MDLLQGVALVVFFVVYSLTVPRWTHKGLIVIIGAVVAGVFQGLPKAMANVIPDVLLITAGLMVLAGFVRRSGVASWLALKVAKVAKGSPGRILFLSGIITWLVAALLGPVAAVVLIVPVCLLLATELDISPLPIVVVLSWASLLGGATTMTALPGHVWLAASWGIDAVSWIGKMAPLTATALVVTLITGLIAFRKDLRVTNERRARVLEYDADQSLGDRNLLFKTLVVLGITIAGLALGPWLGLSPSLVSVAGAVLLWLWDSPRSPDRFLGELDGSILLFYGSLMVVVGWATASVPPGWVETIQTSPLATIGVATILSSFLDQGAVIGAVASLLQGQATSPLWPFLVLATSIGAGVTAIGASSSSALHLTGHGARKVGWRDFSKYGLLFAVVNFVVAGVFLSLLG